jgi:hypothetical protein
MIIFVKWYETLPRKLPKCDNGPRRLTPTQTLTLLARIDPAILSTYLTHILSSLPASSSSQSPATPMDLATLNVLAVKLFDIIELLTTEEGDRYAQGVKEVLGRLDEAQGTPGKKKVLQGAVEKVLVHVRECEYDG